MKYFKSFEGSFFGITIYRVRDKEEQGLKVQYWNEGTHEWGCCFLYDEYDVKYKRNGKEITKFEVLVLCGAEAVDEDRE